jgi:hypothetical protein
MVSDGFQQRTMSPCPSVSSPRHMPGSRGSVSITTPGAVQFRNVGSHSMHSPVAGSSVLKYVLDGQQALI